MTKSAPSQGCKDGSNPQINKCNTNIKRSKNKSHLIISIDAENSSDKIQHHF
jgi:hypothetical protein